jgi:hypothetical protein
MNTPSAKLHDAVRSCNRSTQFVVEPETGKKLYITDSNIIEMPTFSLTLDEAKALQLPPENAEYNQVISSRLPYQNCLIHFNETPKIIGVPSNRKKDDKSHTHYMNKYFKGEFTKNVTDRGKPVFWLCEVEESIQPLRLMKKGTGEIYSESYEDCLVYNMTYNYLKPNGMLAACLDFSLTKVFRPIKSLQNDVLYGEVRTMLCAQSGDKAGQYMSIGQYFEYISDDPRPYTLEGKTYMDKSERADMVWSMFVLLDVGFRKTMQLLSCRNILLKQVELPEKVARKRSKLKKPYFEQYTITVDPTSLPKGVSVEKANQDLWNNRAHDCRGHVREYGIGGKGKLFGKYTGRFWVPPHSRGSKEEGIIEKNYEFAPASVSA